ncbi:MAG: hypothetical protein LBL66_04585 [Clostridiales bacterium]|jgi:hypothetical protein|nr:hypothetical protein [Clostridiales bacterium]
MIKPVTFQGLENFKANLYAVEVRSRFINQAEAHGYYKNYGAELAASAAGNSVAIGTGAFLVCGRMCEVTADETVTVGAADGQVGYIIARVETYRPSDEGNCSFIVKTAASLAAIPLVKDDIYAADSDTVNKAYELPVYSFTVAGGNIQNLTRVLPVIADYATVKQIADDAKSAADGAVLTADAATETADAASTTAGQANTTADGAATVANAANTTAGQAKTIAEGIDAKATAALQNSTNAVDTVNAARADVDGALDDIEQYKNDTTAEVAQLSEQIGEQQGTTVKSGGAAIGTLDLDNDVFNISGGAA